MLLVVVFWVVFSEALFENVTVWLFLVKKLGKKTLLSQKMVKKDTFVFSQIPKDTSVPPKDTSVFKRTLLSHILWEFENFIYCQSKRTLLFVPLMTLLFFKGHFCLTFSRNFKTGRQPKVKGANFLRNIVFFRAEVNWNVDFFCSSYKSSPLLFKYLCF